MEYVTPSRVRVILEYNITPENSQFVPENRPGPQKEAGSFEKTNHFSGVCVNFRECFYLGVVTKNTSWLDDTKNVIFFEGDAGPGRNLSPSNARCGRQGELVADWDASPAPKMNERPLNRKGILVALDLLVDQISPELKHPSEQ